MAGRAYWSGYLKLSLVSCQVKLYSATSSSAGKISFNLLHKTTLNRVNQRYHDPELGEIAREDLVKGYQFEKDRYVVVTPEELEAIEVESSKTIDIDGFVDAGEIDRLYFDSAYYLAPEGPIAQETYKVILEAMKSAKKIALARVVLSGRERLVAIEPEENGFLVSTIRSAKEVRKSSEYLEPIKAKIAPDMLAMAKQIIETKTMAFDPDAFEDRYEQALLALVQSKIKGGQPVISKAPERGNVINLMDALKASVDQAKRPPAASKVEKATGKKATSAAAKTAKAPARKKSSGA